MSITPKAALHVIRRFILAIIRIPGLVSFCIFVTLCAITEQRFSKKFFAENYTWKPAFPSSWRFILLLILVVPVFALVEILRLLAYRFLLPLLIDRWNKALGYGDPSEEGYVMFHRRSSISEHELFNATEEGSALIENAEEGVSGRSFSRPASPTPRLAPHLKWWRLQLFAYIVLFCVSTWVGVHYEQPGDVRYRDAIQEAVAHPRKQGYGKQGGLFNFINRTQLIPFQRKFSLRLCSTIMKMLFRIGTTRSSKSFITSVQTMYSSLSLRVIVPIAPLCSFKR